jgi:DNA-directed RNA polymerase I, II, and III subunit RPABC5
LSPAFSQIEIEAMIIPIRCMNCGNVLADKWVFYQQQIKIHRKNQDHSEIEYMDGTTVPNTVEFQILNALGLNRYCCRKHMLTHVDLLEKI